MRTPRWPTLLALLLAAAPTAPRPAHAQLLHRYFETVDVAHRRADDFELDYDGDVTAGDDANTLGDIFAQIMGPRYRGAAAIDRFGNIGLSAELLTPESTLPFHKQRARALVAASPVFLNTFPYAVHLFSDFVLDGGELFLVGTTGSFARWELELTQPALGDVFFTSGRFEVDAGGTRVLTTHGMDIGAAVDGTRPSQVDIPLSFQTADLGIVAPGEQVYLSYHLEIEVGLGAGAEIAMASFSDPFAPRANGNPIFATLRAVPVVTAVPEPGTLTLAASGLLVLLGGAAAARRRAGG
jgi:hypothetical protein